MQVTEPVEAGPHLVIGDVDLPEIAGPFELTDPSGCATLGSPATAELTLKSYELFERELTIRTSFIRAQAIVSIRWSTHCFIIAQISQASVASSDRESSTGLIGKRAAAW